MTDASETWVRRHEPWVYIGGTLVLVIGSMLLWRHVVVDPWAAQESARYSVPGAFGDSFAPLVGAISSLALGAAVASVLIQSRELRAQGGTIEQQGNVLAKATNNLAMQAKAQQESSRILALAATLTCIERLDKLDKMGTETVAGVLATMPPEVRAKSWGTRHSKGIWLELTRAQGLLPGEFQGFEVIDLFSARRAVANIMEQIQPSRSELLPEDGSTS